VTSIAYEILDGSREADVAEQNETPEQSLQLNEMRRSNSAARSSPPRVRPFSSTPPAMHVLPRTASWDEPFGHVIAPSGD
jgi:hypothetical protein